MPRTCARRLSVAPTLPLSTGRRWRVIVEEQLGSILMLTNKDGAHAVQAEDVDGALPACIASTLQTPNSIAHSRMLPPNGSSTTNETANELSVEQMLPCLCCPALCTVAIASHCCLPVHRYRLW